MDGRVVIYDLRTATKWRVFSGHKGSIQAVAFSEDGEFLASCASFILKVRSWVRR